MNVTFFNTIQLSGQELKTAVAKAQNQEAAILLIFKNTRKPFTASEITRLTEKAGRNFPIWSNRRAITNLMNRKEINKLSEMKMGEMGRPEHKYQINFLKYPSVQGVQIKLL